MKLLRRAALNGVQLDEIDSRILIQSIEPAAGKDQQNTVSLWGGDGSRMTGEHRDSLDVTVQFSLDMKRSAYAERSEIFEKIAEWAAGGGWLTISTKPGRRIRVISAQIPGEGDALKWTSRYSILFRAFGVPYWQQETAGLLRVTGESSVTRNFGVGGTRETVMDATFKNTSGGTINSFDLTCGGSVFHLRNLGLANGETLEIDHDDNGRRCNLRIRIQSTAGAYRSAMNKRTTGSSDDLTVTPGSIRVVMSAGGAGTLLISCAGRYV